MFCLFDVTEQGYPSHGPMLGPNVTLKVDGADVVEVCPRWLPVNWALVQLRVLASRRVDGINVNHRHLLVQDLGPRLDQLASLSVQTGAFQKQT